MESNKFKKIIERFLGLGGDAILEIDIVESNSGSILESYNKDEETSKSFNKLYDNLEEILANAGFLKDLDYYYLGLDNHMIWLVGKIGSDHRYFSLIDSSKVKLGLFFKYLKELKEDA